MDSVDKLQEVAVEEVVFQKVIPAAELSKILSEKYKIIVEKKRFIIDGMKLLIWFYATSIALNYISLNTEKIYGLFPFEQAFLKLYIVIIASFSVGLLRLVSFVFHHALDIPAICSFPEKSGNSEMEWEDLSFEFRSLIENDLMIVKNGKSLLAWSLRWLASGFGLSLLPIGIKAYYRYFS